MSTCALLSVGNVKAVTITAFRFTWHTSDPLASSSSRPYNLHSLGLTSSCSKAVNSHSITAPNAPIFGNPAPMLLRFLLHVPMPIYLWELTAIIIYVLILDFYPYLIGRRTLLWHFSTLMNLFLVLMFILRNTSSLIGLCNIYFLKVNFSTPKSPEPEHFQLCLSSGATFSPISVKMRLIKTPRRTQLFVQFLHGSLFFLSDYKESFHGSFYVAVFTIIPNTQYWDVGYRQKCFLMTSILKSDSRTN